MATDLLESHDHYCFHSPMCNVHEHPTLHHCMEEMCPGAIHEDMANQAGHVDEDGFIRCPVCGCHTWPKEGEVKAEVHAKLCTDPTIHYPEMHKAGQIDKATFDAWKATLTRAELMGHYKRTPDIHVSAKFSHDETKLMNDDLDAFNTLVGSRLRERATTALLHQANHRHTTRKEVVDLTSHRKGTSA